MLLASNGDRRRRGCPAGADVDAPEISLVFIKRHKTALQGNIAPGWLLSKASAFSEWPQCGGLSALQQQQSYSREAKSCAATALGLTVICICTPGRARFPLALPLAQLLTGCSQGLCCADTRRACGLVCSAGDRPCVRMLHNGLFASSISLKTLPAWD